MGIACNLCNVREKQQIFIPVTFHNGSGHDFCFLNWTLYHFLILSVQSFVFCDWTSQRVSRVIVLDEGWQVEFQLWKISEDLRKRVLFSQFDFFGEVQRRKHS